MSEGGNPVKSVCLHLIDANGDYVPMVGDTNGQLVVGVLGFGVGGWSAINRQDVSTSGFNSAQGLVTASCNYLYNVSNSSFVHDTPNLYYNLISSGAYTATQTTALQVNTNSKGGHFILDVTAIGGAAPSITVDILGHDGVINKDYILLTSLPVTTVGTNVLKIYPGIATISNGAAADIVPYFFKVRVNHANADSITYSVSASLNR